MLWVHEIRSTCLAFGWALNFIQDIHFMLRRIDVVLRDGDQRVWQYFRLTNKSIHYEFQSGRLASNSLQCRGLGAVAMIQARASSVSKQPPSISSCSL